MVSFSTRTHSELPYLYAYSPKLEVLPGRFSLLLVMGYAAALTVLQGNILPQYEFVLN